MNRFPPGPPQRHPGPQPYAAAPPGYGAPPPGYGSAPRAPEGLIPPPGSEASVASIVFALIGQSEKRIEAHAIEMEKLGAGLQHLRAETTQMLSAIRPDTQRRYLFDSLLQDARGRAEESKHTNLEVLIQQERDLQASYQRILDEGLPMISGALDPNRGLPRGWEHQPPPRHVVAASSDRRAPPQASPLPRPRAASPMGGPMMPPQRHRPGPVVMQGPPSPPPRGPMMQGPAMAPPSAATSAYSSAFKKKAASKESAALKSETKNELKIEAESKPKLANGPSAPSVAASPEHDESDRSTT